TPLLARLTLRRGDRPLLYRKLVAPLPRPRRVDDHARVVALDVRRDGRIERAGPGPVDDVEGALGIRTGQHGPHDVVDVGDIDVLVHHDDDAAQVRADAAHRGDVSGLPGVPRVALLDRDRVQESAASDPEAVRVDDAGHAGRLELAQKECASQIFAVAVRLVRRLVWRDAEDDRIVAVVDGLNLEDRLRARARGVIAGPLAERTLGRALVVMEEPREHDLRGSRHRQTGDRLSDDLVRLATDPAGPVVLTDALRHLERRRDEKQRVDAADNQDWARRLALEVRVAELPPMLAG